MSSDLKLQGIVEMSSEGAENALNRIGEKADAMASNVVRAADRAGKAADGIGGGATRSAEEFNRAEGKIVASIKRATTQLEQMGKTASQKLEMRINTQGLDPSRFEPMLAKLRELEAAQVRAGVAGKGMGQGLQNTSYQLQDFIVQVNGGTDATKALAMQLPQMLVGFGTAGAAIGVVAALLPNLISLFGNSADSAITFKDAMSDFDKAIGNVGQTVRTFDLDPLYEQFNNSSAAVRAATIEQLKFQQEYIRTTQLISEKKLGESVGKIVNYGFLDKISGNSAVEGLARQLGIATEAATDLMPALVGIKNGTADVNLVSNEFGRVLLKGNGSAIELAATISELAKSDRDAAAASTALSEALGKMAKGHVTTKKEAEEAANASKKAAKESESLAGILDRINGKESGFSPEYVQTVEKLLMAYGKGKLSLEEFNAVFSRYVAMQPGAVAAAKAAAQAEEDAARARAAGFAEMVKNTDSLQAQVEKMRLENEEIGLTTEQLDALKLARLDEAIAAKEQALAYAEKNSQSASEIELLREQAAALREVRELTASNQIKTANKRALDEQTKAWENFSRDIERSLTDSLYRAFENGEDAGQALAKSLENTFKTMVLKVVVQGVVSVGSNAVSDLLGLGSGSSGSASGGAGLLNSVSNLFSAGKGAYSLYSSGVGGTMGAYVQGLGNLVGSSTMSAYGTGMGLSTLQAESAALAYEAAAQSTGQAIYSEIATSILEGAEAGAASSGLAGGAMTAMGYAGAFMAAVGLLFNDWDSGGAPKTAFRGWGSISDGKVLAGELGNPLGEYTGGRTDRDYVHEVIDGLLNDAFVASLQKINADYDASAYLGGLINWQGKSSNQMSAKAANADGELIYSVSREKGQGTDGWKKFLDQEGPRLQAALMFDAMRTESEDYAAIVAATVGPTTDLTSALKDLSNEGITQLTGQVYDMISLFEQFNERAVFSSDIAADQFISLTKAAGGADKLYALTDAYLATAYTEQELFERQFSTLKTKLEDGFDSLILNIPTDPIEIQGMISNIDLSTTAGKTAMDQIAQQLAGVQAEKPTTVTELQAAIAQAGLGTEAGSGMLQELIKEVGAVVVAKQSEGGLSTLTELKGLASSANITISDPGMSNISDQNLQNAIIFGNLAQQLNAETLPGITNYVNGLATTGAGTSPGGVDEYLVMLSDSTQDFNNLIAGLDASTTAGKAIFEALAGGIQNLGVAAPQTTEELAALAAGLDLNTTAGQAIMDAIGQGLGEIGVAMPATVEEFNKLVEATYQGGKINEEAFLGLMNLYEDFQAMTETISGFGDVRQGIIDSYKTDAQKQADLQATLVEAFAKVNEAVPKTVDQFVALAMKADPATESGRALISTLQQVQEAFDQTASYGQKFALSRIEFNVSAFQDLAQSGLTYLQSAAELESQRAQAAQQAAQESISSINSIVISLSSAAQDLYSNVSSTAGYFAAQASAQLDEMLATAQTTGYLPEQNTLNTAIQAARAGLTRENFASQYDYERAQLVLAGKLTQLQELSAAQLPAAEQALNVANSQLTAAQQALDYYEHQVNLLLGIEESSWSLTGSIEEIGAAILESLNNQGKTIADSIIAALAAGRIGAADAATQLGGLGYTDTLKNGIAAGSNGAVIAGGSLYAANGWTGSVDSARRIVAEAFGAMDPADFYSAALSVGLSGRMIEQMYDMPAGTAAAWAKANNLPAFAVGTDYVPQDMLALVHQGEAITPVAYRGEQEKLLSSLIAEVQALRARLDDVAESTQSTAQAVNGRGRAPMLVETA